ncbi:MAG: glycosyltransferase family 4 protein [Planctomycetes bacterium]|nr:glycosyltransferase family 4 protein [Planctomycetota bacterium]
MKILFIEHYFQPEPNFFVGLPFAKALMDAGHEVQVLTGFPNYPGGKIYDGYKVKFMQRETMDGVPVIRLPIYPSHNKSSIKRILSYTSLSLSQSLIGPFAVKDADVAFVSQGPATIGLPAIVHKLFRRIPFVYNIMDLWPDSLASTGMLNNKALLKIVNTWCNFVYKRASMIVAISPGMKQILIERGVPEEKIEVVYNWCDSSLICREEPNQELARELGMDGKFNILFAGGMGKAQAIGSVIEAARLLEKDKPDIQFVFIGSGVEVESLKQRVAELSLSNVIFHPLKPISEIGSILRIADVLLVHLRDDPLFRITVPSKTQAYLATGRPVLMGVKGDASKLVEDAKAGLRCEPENSKDIAEKVLKFYEMDRGDLQEMGDNGMDYYDKNLSFEFASQRYIEIFESVKRK